MPAARLSGRPDRPPFPDFARLYRELRPKGVTRQEHRAGEKVFTDWSGMTMTITDPATGKETEEQVFVATLGASSFTYAEIFATQELHHWVAGHVHAYEYMKGVPAITVPDYVPRHVIRQKPVRHAAEMLEGSHVAVEERNLVLALVESGEVPARAHEADDEQECLGPLACQVDPDLEEIDLAEIAGQVLQRHENLAAAALVLGHVRLDQRHPDLVARFDEHPVQARRCLRWVRRGESARISSIRARTRSSTGLGLGLRFVTPGSAPAR